MNLRNERQQESQEDKDCPEIGKWHEPNFMSSGD